MGVYVNQKLNNSYPGNNPSSNRASNIYDDVETRDPPYDNNVMIEAMKRHNNLHANQGAGRNSHSNQHVRHGNQKSRNSCHGNQGEKRNINAINNLGQASASAANNIEDLYTKPGRLTPNENIAGKLSPSKIMAFEKPAVLPKPVRSSARGGGGLVPSAPVMPVGSAQPSGAHAGPAGAVRMHRGSECTAGMHSSGIQAAPAGMPGKTHRGSEGPAGMHSGIQAAGMPPEIQAAPAAPAGMPSRSRNKKCSIDDGYSSHSDSNSSLLNLQEGENILVENDLYHCKKNKNNK